MISGRLSSFLDAARWISASLVLLSHVRAGLFLDYSSLPSQTIVDAVFYAATKLGHQAVLVFFVISGFLVGGIASTKWRAGKQTLRLYMSARFSRIYVVLVPALVLGLIVDWAGASHWPAAYPHDLAERLNARAFLINLLCLQTTFDGAHPFGTNRPLWSLANEWWYYCVFGLLCTGLAARSLALAALCAASIITIMALLPSQISTYALFWAMGVATFYAAQAWAWRPLLLPSWLIFLASVYVSLYLRAGITDPDVNLLAPDFLLAVCFSFVLLAYAREGDPLPFAGLHQQMAEFSFSLYAIHNPLVTFKLALLSGFGVGKLTLGWDSAIYFVVLVAVAVVAAKLFHQLFESRTGEVRAALDRLIARQWPGRVLREPR